MTMRAAASASRRRCSSSQNRSSDQSSTSLVERHLQIVAAAGRRAHRAQREAALVVGVDQFVAHGGTSARMPSQPKG